MLIDNTGIQNTILDHYFPANYSQNEQLVIVNTTSS